MADKAGETKSVGSALKVRAFVSKGTSKVKAAYLRVRALRAAPLDRKVLAAVTCQGFTPGEHGGLSFTIDPSAVETISPTSMKILFSS